MLSKPNIISIVNSHHFPPKSFILFAGTVLAMHGLRDTNDVDMVCSQELFDQCVRDGWETEEKNGVLFVSSGDTEMCTVVPHTNAVVSELLSRAEVIDGLPCASLQDVRAFKQQMNRKKDIADIALIDAYLARS